MWWVLFLVFGLASAGWIDPHSDSDVFTTKSLDSGASYDLVFSDEFNVQGRRFDDGSDPRWTALHKNDYTNNALQYYNKNLVTTKDGSLHITSKIEDVSFKAQVTKSGNMGKLTKNYQSGMLQGWNKFCFTGGIVEIRARLPGRSDIGGLWPAMWLLGNLARATYVGSSDNMWPWSFDKCVTKLQFGQEISACNAVNHFDFPPHKGRGAPEIDLLEAMPGAEELQKTHVNRPYFSTSLQVSPGIEEWRPETGNHPDKNHWYSKDLEYGTKYNSSLNIFFYGVKLENLKDSRKAYQADAISANNQLNADHFDEFHTYRLEWTPGKGGGIKWYLDNHFLYSIGERTLNITGAQIPEEPMYLILNTAISKTWGFPTPCPDGCACDCYDCRDLKCKCAVPDRMCENFPADFEIDWVRVYQNPNDGKQIVGCSTPDYPTSRYIKGHERLFMSDGDTAPLQPLKVGGGACGGPMNLEMCHHGGSCVRGECKCTAGWVGPHCMASAAFDDIDWEPSEPFVIDLPHVPTSLRIWLILILIVCGGVLGYVWSVENAKRTQYSSIPH